MGRQKIINLQNVICLQQFHAKVGGTVVTLLFRDFTMLIIVNYLIVLNLPPATVSGLIVYNLCVTTQVLLCNRN